jgi:hypothetical protein
MVKRIICRTRVEAQEEPKEPEQQEEAEPIEEKVEEVKPIEEEQKEVPARQVDYRNLEKFVAEITEEIENGAVHGLLTEINTSGLAGFAEDQMFKDLWYYVGSRHKNIGNAFDAVVHFVDTVTAPANVTTIENGFWSLRNGPRWFAEALAKGEYKEYFKREYPSWVSLSLLYHGSIDLLNTYGNGRKMVGRVTTLVKGIKEHLGVEEAEEERLNNIASRIQQLARNCTALGLAYDQWRESMKKVMQDAADFYGFMQYRPIY